jgi:hypothetical protein
VLEDALTLLQQRGAGDGCEWLRAVVPVAEKTLGLQQAGVQASEPWLRSLER